MVAQSRIAAMAQEKARIIAEGRMPDPSDADIAFLETAPEAVFAILDGLAAEIGGARGRSVATAYMAPPCPSQPASHPHRAGVRLRAGDA